MVPEPLDDIQCVSHLQGITGKGCGAGKEAHVVFAACNMLVTASFLGSTRKHQNLVKEKVLCGQIKDQ